MPDVLVAGAGPTGLLAAFELERAGLDVLVLDRDTRPTTQSKALGLQPRSVEVLADRGLLAAIEPYTEARLPGGHFSGIHIDYTDLPTPFPYQLGVEQVHVAAAIEARLRTPVLRDAAVTAVAQDDDGVTVTAGGREHRAGFGWWRPTEATARSGRCWGRRFPVVRRGSRWSSPTSRSPASRPGSPTNGGCRRSPRGSCCRCPAAATAWSSSARSSSGSAATSPSRPASCSEP